MFDKTGTLTNGAPRVCKFDWMENLIGEQSFVPSKNEGLKMIASLQRHVKHVFSDAIVNYYLEEENNSFYTVVSFQYFPGLGVHGTVEGKDDEKFFVVIGSQRFLEQQNVWSIMKNKNENETDLLSQSHFCIKNKEALVSFGTISYKDEIRRESVELIERLKRRNLKVVLLSGVK